MKEKQICDDIRNKVGELNMLLNEASKQDIEVSFELKHHGHHSEVHRTFPELLITKIQKVLTF